MNEPLLRVTWTDPITTRHAYLVIDRLIGGISGGGTRVREGCTLAEVERLAQTMTLKNGGLDLPVGGAKCGLDIDPHDAETHGMLVRFVRILDPTEQTLQPWAPPSKPSSTTARIPPWSSAGRRTASTFSWMASTSSTWSAATGSPRRPRRRCSTSA